MPTPKNILQILDNPFIEATPIKPEQQTQFFRRRFPNRSALEVFRRNLNHLMQM